MNTTEQLQLSQWILERNLNWIAAAETKCGVVVTIDTAMLATLAATFGARAFPDQSAWAILWTIVAGAGLVAAIFCCAMTVLPTVVGPERSFIFFGRIAKQTQADYIASFTTADGRQIVDDCLAQVHRNAEIACEKFQWIRAGMMWSFFATLPWALALLLLMQVRGSN